MSNKYKIESNKDKTQSNKTSLHMCMAVSVLYHILISTSSFIYDSILFEGLYLNCSVQPICQLSSIYVHSGKVDFKSQDSPPACWWLGSLKIEVNLPRDYCVWGGEGEITLCQASLFRPDTRGGIHSPSLLVRKYHLRTCVGLSVPAQCIKNTTW